MAFTAKHQRLFEAWEGLRSKWAANGLTLADMLELELIPGSKKPSEAYRIVIAGQTARVPLTGFEDLGGTWSATRILRMALATLVINEAGPRDGA